MREGPEDVLAKHLARGLRSTQFPHSVVRGNRRQIGSASYRAAVRASRMPGADTVDDGPYEKQSHHRPKPHSPCCKRAANGDKDSECAEKHRTVTLAEWPVVTPAGADRLTQYAGKFRQHREENDCHDRHQAVRIDQRKRQIQGNIGHDIADLVEIGAQNALLPMFAREHAVNGIEAHTQEKPDGHQQEQLRKRSNAQKKAKCNRDGGSN